MIPHRLALTWSLIFLLAYGLMGCNTTQPEPLKPGQVVIGRPSPSPDGRHILVPISTAKGSGIYRIQANGSEIKCLITSGEQMFSEPVYSPDGSQIVYCSAKNASKPYGLYRMKPDGSAVQPIKIKIGDAREPVFSHDGKTIYFLHSGSFGHFSPIAQSHPHDFDIYQVNADGSGLKRLTDRQAFQISSPSLSPDDKHLLFQMDDSAPDSLWLFKLEAPETFTPIRPAVQQFVPTAAGKEPLNYNDFYYPQFSPNGKSILFTWAGHYQGYFGHEIYLMDTESRRTKKLTNLHAYIVEPVFASDGRSVYFLKADDATSSEGRFELWQINLDGSQCHPIKMPGFNGN